MKIVQLRVRGLGPAPVTKWIKMQPGLNLVEFASPEAGKRFLQAVQTVNPPYDCRSLLPFDDYPLQEKRDGYIRQISPEKRTIAMSVFNTESDLVRELGEISPLLYETDRIEVGRRLDNSRWVNFVEIASSTRWSEIDDQIRALRCSQTAKNTDTAEVDRLLKTIRKTDRIKGEPAEILIEWLTACGQYQAELVEAPNPVDLLEAVRRAELFSAGRTLVRKKLPLFILINPTAVACSQRVAEFSGDLGPMLQLSDNEIIESGLRAVESYFPYEFAGRRHRLVKQNTKNPAAIFTWAGFRPVKKIMLLCGAIINYCLQRNETKPVFLLDLSTLTADVADNDFAAFLSALADHCQCIGVVDKSKAMSDLIEKAALQA
ncbi:MAG: hypothetical protein WBW79_18375 [Desulfocapsaceae bacterium]